MIIGILVNTDRHLAHIAGLTQAALRKGHAVDMFVMDDGAKLLTHPDLQALAALDGVALSYCMHNAEQRGLASAELPSCLTGGSQLNNAAMNRRADKVIVL